MEEHPIRVLFYLKLPYYDISFIKMGLNLQLTFDSNPNSA